MDVPCSAQNLHSRCSLGVFEYLPLSISRLWALNGAFDLKFTSGNYDWDASNYEIGPFGRSLPLTTGNNNKFYMLVLS